MVSLINAEDLNDYVEEWTDNPAWCVLDFMTRFNGCGMDIEDVEYEEADLDEQELFAEPDSTPDEPFIV